MKRGMQALLLCAGVVLAGLLAFYRPGGEAKAQSQFEPSYRGIFLLLPQDFTSWIFVGSNLGLGYSWDMTANTPAERTRQEPAKYHNVYISPPAYAAYKQTRQFPDKTVLVMDVYEAQNREAQGVVNQGSFNGARLGVEVAVKNRNRPDGETTDWAYYNFSGGGPGQLLPEARAAPNVACYDCHKAHAGDDNVWVQFYPTLRRIKQPD
jgi:Cytochrome P460